jgi:hypothetical protein
MNAWASDQDEIDGACNFMMMMPEKLGLDDCGRYQFRYEISSVFYQKGFTLEFRVGTVYALNTFVEPMFWILWLLCDECIQLYSL